MASAPSAIRAPVAAPTWPLLEAPAAWRCIDFISDLHLDPDQPETFLAWRHYLSHSPADAVFILGDLFEVWVGDDAIAADPAGFEARCARTLRKAASRRALFFMRGNRDFLVGAGFALACGVTLLDDPTVLQFAGQRWLLSHGDALCLADTDYLAFRALVRAAPWQQQFLAQTLAERRATARELRQRSEARKGGTAPWADVDATEVAAWLRTADAPFLIHGHTHRPADHVLTGGLQRIVLSDWDLRADPARAQVLRVDAQARIARLGVHRLDAPRP